VNKIKFVVGITGGSGVGKTTLIKRLYEKFSNRVSTFSLDNYYLPKDQQRVDENGVVNFDLPTALDQDKIQRDLSFLMNGKSVSQQIYQFNNPQKKQDQLVINPNDLLIVEGLYVMHYLFVRELINYSVYLSVDPELQLQRRLHRDTNERNYSKEDVLYQWQNHVLPSYQNFVYPFKQQADLIITNNENFDENIHTLTAIIAKNIGIKNENPV